MCLAIPTEWTRSERAAIDPDEIEPLEIEPLEIEPLEIEPREIEPREIEPREIEPREIEPREIELVRCVASRDRTTRGRDRERAFGRRQTTTTTVH